MTKKKARTASIPGAEHRIRIINKQKRLRLPLKRLQDLAVYVLRAEHENRGRLSIVFVNDAEIAGYHKKYMKQKGATDVLSFPWRAKMNRYFYWGDILISTDRAAAQARTFETTVMHEICLYVVHGVLHLLGWTDQSRSEFLKMKTRQGQILVNYKLLRGISHL